MILALGALAIDITLPAFDDIRRHFNLGERSTAAAGIVTVFILGMAIAQVFYGPLADRFGRKRTLYGGFTIYALGALGAVLAPSFNLLLVSRFIWGVGAAGSRVIAISIVRDTYEGDEMSRAMSHIMAVFILIPILAPSVGTLIISATAWQGVFWFSFVVVMIVAVWAARRLPETLDPGDAIKLDFRGVTSAFRVVVTNRQTMGYTLAMTFAFGVFLSYIASSELIVGEIYGRPALFPFVFGGIAIAMGAALIVNGRTVERVGARRLLHLVLTGYVIGAVTLFLLTSATGGKPAFWLFIPALAVMFSMHALLIPNFNTVAMLSVGHVAGTASAVFGTVSLAGGALLGSVIDRQYRDTVTPLTRGFLIYGLLALASVAWAERGRLFVNQPALDHLNE